MKKVLMIWLAVALSLLPTTTIAQAQAQEMVTVPKRLLTTEQLAASRLESAGRFAGLGAEIGEAVGSSLSAVSQHASEFAETKVGKVTVAIVVWKVIGSDLTKLFIAVIFFFGATPVALFIFYRQAMRRRYVLKETFDADGKRTSVEYRETDVGGETQFLYTIPVIICGILVPVIALGHI